MNLILDDARIEQTENGLFFYEEDTVFLPYLFTNDLEVELELKYRYPGIGFCLIKNSGKPMFENETSYLFHCDENKLIVYNKYYSQQKIISQNTCLFETKEDHRNVRFIKKGKTICIEENDQILGELLLEDSPESFYFGIYSAANNSIRSMSIKESCPQYWFSSIDNTDGGRISFSDNKITIENCLYDAQIEQTNILLNPGVYFLKYELEDISDVPNNLEVFLFEAQDEKIFDRNKNLLDENNRFSLDKSKRVAIRIRGNSGIIKNICITEKPENQYIPTYDRVREEKGSMIKFDLAEIAMIEMKFEIKDIPIYELEELANYFIIRQSNDDLLIEDLQIQLDKQYTMFFDSTMKLLNLYENGTIFCSKIIETDDILEMFYNVTGTIFELSVWDYNNNEIDIAIQRTFKKYVPGYLDTPIIVTDEEGNPLDISSECREAIIEETKIDIIRADAWNTTLSQTIMPDKKIEVFGLANDALIRANKQTIEETCSVYTKLNNNEFEINYDTNKIFISENRKKEFDNFAVVYTHMDNVLYWFTNWKRIYQENTRQPIKLDNAVNPTSGSVIVYGIKDSDQFKEENIYKVFNYRAETSIDCAADNYDQLSEAAFTLNDKTNELEIDRGIADDYEIFVIDYLKNDSYAINYLSDSDQYEVDISTAKNKVTMLYDMNNDGSVSSYRSVDIVPTSSKYIVLRG